MSVGIDRRRVLAVCTANVGRSPVAERLLQREWDAAGLATVVASAGTVGGVVDELHPYTIEAAGLTGLDITDHRPRLLDGALIADDGADLVVVMTQEHLVHVVALDESAWPRTFTLRELARRTTELGPQPTWDAWLERCHDGRHPSDYLRANPRNDLPDPYRRPASDHVLMVGEVSEHAAVIADAVARSG